MRRFIVLGLLLAVGLASFMGCGGGGKETEPQGATKRVGRLPQP